MSFKTTNTQDVPAPQFERALGVAAQMRREAVAYRDQAVAGSIRLMDIETGLLSTLRNVRTELVRAQATPGLVTYAKTQFETAYDIAAEFTGMMTEINTTLAWLESNFPKDAGGRLLSKTFVGDGSGRVQSEILTNPTALTALAARLNALIATID